MRSGDWLQARYCRARFRFEKLGRLHLDADTQIHGGVRAAIGDVDAAETDAARARAKLAGQHLEEGALPRSIRPDQAVDMAGGQLEIDLTESRPSQVRSDLVDEEDCFPVWLAKADLHGGASSPPSPHSGLESLQSAGFRGG